MTDRSIPHTCGHTSCIPKSVHGKERAKMLEQGRSEPCAVCKEQAINAERQRLRQDAEASFEGLWTPPPLEGSEKQIDWAADLRAKVLKILADLLTAELDGPSFIAMVPRVQAELDRLPSAKTWIDRRFFPEDTARSLWKAAILRNFSRDGDLEVFLQENNEVLFLLNGLPYRKRWFNRVIDTSLMPVLFPKSDWYDLEMFVREQHRSVMVDRLGGGG